MHDHGPRPLPREVVTTREFVARVWEVARELCPTEVVFFFRCKCLFRKWPSWIGICHVFVSDRSFPVTTSPEGGGLGHYKPQRARSHRGLLPSPRTWDGQKEAKCVANKNAFPPLFLTPEASTRLGRVDARDEFPARTAILTHKRCAGRLDLKDLVGVLALIQRTLFWLFFHARSVQNAMLAILSHALGGRGEYNS